MGMEGNWGVATENDPDEAEIKSPVAKCKTNVRTIKPPWFENTMKMDFVLEGWMDDSSLAESGRPWG